MKKKIIALIITCVMLISSTVMSVFAADVSDKTVTFFKDGLTRIVSVLLNGIAAPLNYFVKEGENFIKAKDYTLENFYEGTSNLLDSPAENARWSLGYDSASLVPENYTDYYLGGFMTIQNGFSNKIKGVYDDMKVRTVAISDGSGRGTSVFATIDCIGISNADIREIRSMLSDFAAENNLCAINIFSTHCHSCIDTQGLWTGTFKTIFGNLFSSTTGIGSAKKGTNPAYMEFLYENVKQSIMNAVFSMVTGTMTLARKDIGSEYFSNKNRENATALMTDLTKFEFTPDDSSIRPVIIANLAAHPDVVGLATKGDDSNGQMLSGDYVYYIGETLDKAGYDFMFFNGAICGIYIGRSLTSDGVSMDHRVEISQRYGREIGRILLAMSMTKEEILADEFLSVTGDTEEEMANPSYTLWYENWEKTEATEVKPLLNVRLMSVTPPVTNPVIQLAGKLRLANYEVIVNGKRQYSVATEIGFVQIGDTRIIMVPGELCQDLVAGGASLTSEGSISHTDFSGKTLYEIFGDDIIVFGLANDAIGYILPDNDYCNGLIFSHYQEILSLGKNEGSYLMGQFEELAKLVK